MITYTTASATTPPRSTLRLTRSTLRGLSLLLSLSVTFTIGCVDSHVDQVDQEESRRRAMFEKGDDVTEGGRPAPETEEISDSTGESLNRPGIGDQSGLTLISGYVGDCVAYPISDVALLTSWSCLEECVTDEYCQVAVLTDSGPDTLFYGITNRFYHIGAGEAGSFGVIVADEPKAWRVYDISTDLSGDLNTIAGNHELSYSSESAVQVSDAEDAHCDFVGLGLFNAANALVGVRLDAERCDTFTPLMSAFDQIESARAGQFAGLEQMRPGQQEEQEREEQEEQEREEQEEQEREDQEARWASDEYSAELDAPACSQGDPNYCVGDVEMSCSNGVYTAFNCQRVGWACVDDPSWGYACAPAETP